MIRDPNMSEILQTAQQGFAAQAAELAAIQQRLLSHVITKSATGSTDISQSMGLDRQFRLIYVRCHFTAGVGSAQLTVSVDSAKATAYHCQLIKILQAGTGKDVFRHVSQTNLEDPSPWTIDTGDAVKIAWINPDPGLMTWGLECGFALAS